MITEIFWLISWPVLIAVSYFLTVWLVKKYEEKTENE